MPKVSVIIPVYNAEEYLHQCLDSVINQTLKDIEIICVDDGSTDKSLQILNDFAARDSRIRILTQVNINAGAARNRGLSVATGEYLSFLDADDFFELDMLERAYKQVATNAAEIVVFGSDQFIQSEQAFKEVKWTIRRSMLPKQNVFSLRDIHRDRFRMFVGWAWDKLFKREFIVSNGLLFQEQRTTNDMYFVFCALVRAQRICVLDQVLVHQRKQTAGTLSVTREKSWHCFYDALTKIRNQLKEWNTWDWMEQDFVNYAAHSVLWNFNSLQAETQRKLFAKLNDNWLFDLGISTNTADYFYNKNDYTQLMKIAAYTYEQYTGTTSEQRPAAVRSEHPKVSLVLPSLNVVRYIRECIESALNQTMADIEIICVDAGSNDGTLEILEEYAKKDPRVTIIRSDKKSYGYQMNLGFDAARGEYIGILETDDYIKEDMLQRLYEIAKANKLDFIKADFFRFVYDNDGNINLFYHQLSKTADVYGKVLNPQEELQLFRLIMNTWSGIYSNKFLRDNNIRHNETPGASYQDNGFWFQTFALATRVYFVNTPYYMNRRDNPNSSVYNRNKVYCINDEYKFIKQFIEEHPDLKSNLLKPFCIKMFYGCMNTFKRIIDEFKLEYLLNSGKEFSELQESGELDLSWFSPNEQRMLDMFINNPVKYYLEYSDFLDNNEISKIKAMETMLIQKDQEIAQLNTVITNYNNSISYRIGRKVTAIPRKLKALFKKSP